MTRTTPKLAPPFQTSAPHHSSSPPILVESKPYGYKGKVYRAIRYQCDKLAGSVRGGHKDDSESHSIAGSEMPSRRATVKRSKEKEQKQQRVSVAEIILMTNLTLVKSYSLQKAFEISTRSSHTGFTTEPLRIPNVLEDSWHVLHLPGSY
ncbi:hypothetical protein AVEN_167166-1 [Araneus ventricosus]|uniref:Uncharacterized protein n=1 Tax=Araneus ventricosus TaxID=182803 RepID=A0A4Y2G4Z9_ARAVE|nr:hypothetical protein AVEN_167166-1 [Araneus ventricosus]